MLVKKHFTNPLVLIGKVAIIGSTIEQFGSFTKDLLAYMPQVMQHSFMYLNLMAYSNLMAYPNLITEPYVANSVTVHIAEPYVANSVTVHIAEPYVANSVTVTEIFS